MVCDRSPCQNNRASNPPFTFHPAAPSCSLTTGPDKDLSGRDNRINNPTESVNCDSPARPNPVGPLMCLILPSHPRELQGALVLFWLLGSAKPQKANFPFLILLGGCFLKSLKPSPFSQPHPFSKEKIHLPPPQAPLPLPLPVASSLDASTSAVSCTRRGRGKRNLLLLKIANISSASSLSDILL